MTERTCRACGSSITDIVELVMHEGCDEILRAVDLTNSEQDTLLYVESCLVDPPSGSGFTHGDLDPARMNHEDQQNLKVFKAAGVLDVSEATHNPDDPRSDIIEVEEFTDAAWRLAHECRKLRAHRNVDRDIDIGTEPGDG